MFLVAGSFQLDILAYSDISWQGTEVLDLARKECASLGLLLWSFQLTPPVVVVNLSDLSLILRKTLSLLLCWGKKNAGLGTTSVKCGDIRCPASVSPVLGSQTSLLSSYHLFE